MRGSTRREKVQRRHSALARANGGLEVNEATIECAAEGVWA